VRLAAANIPKSTDTMIAKMGAVIASSLNSFKALFIIHLQSSRHTNAGGGFFCRFFQKQLGQLFFRNRPRLELNCEFLDESRSCKVWSEILRFFDTAEIISVELEIGVGIYYLVNEKQVLRTSRARDDKVTLEPSSSGPVAGTCFNSDTTSILYRPEI
jgi:hypothetical protein